MISKQKVRGVNQFGFDHVFLSLGIVIIFGIIGTGWYVLSHAASWSGILEVYSQNSGYCLTANGGGTGSTVELDSCAKTRNVDQIWTLNDTGSVTYEGKTYQGFDLQSAAGSNECLNDWQQSKANGTQMRLYACSGSDVADIWIWGVQDESNGFSPHQLGNLGSFEAARGAWLCLDDAGGSNAPGTKVDIYTCKTSRQSNQEWFENSAPSATNSTTGSSSTTSGSSTTTGTPKSPISSSNPPSTGTTSEGALSVYSDTSGHCLEDKGDTTTVGTAVILDACNNSIDQKWILTPAGYDKNDDNAPQYTIGTYQAGTQLCIDNWQAKATLRNPIKLYTCDGIGDTAELWVWAGAGNHQLMNPATGMCLDDLDGSDANGATIDLYTCKTSSQSNQQWFKITNTASASTSPSPSTTQSGQSSSDVSADIQAIVEALKAQGYSFNCSSLLAAADVQACESILGQ